MSPKIILVIGATGAQGRAVVTALLAPAADGTKSPYAVRALTRDPASRSARELTEQGVECVKGTFEDLETVAAAFQGVYGAWVNTDGSTVGEQRETYAALRIFEIAKATPSVRHYVWSSLDYSTKKGGYKPEYRVAHYNGKGRIADFLKAQPSVVSDTELSWSVVTSGPYMDMLDIHMFGPLNKRADGTFVFASPIGDGHVPMVALSDIGWWARYTFDHRAETSAKDLEIASDWVSWDYLVKTFTEVTGKKAIYLRQTLPEWWSNFRDVDIPFASENGDKPDGTITIRENFSGFWAQWRDDVITRDFAWLRKVHPGTRSLADWMRETGFSGERFTRSLLKNAETGTRPAFRLNRKQMAKL